MTSSLDRERDAYVLGLLRSSLAALLLLFTTKQALRWSSFGHFADYFHIPMLPAAWVPSRGTYALLLAIQAFCAALAITGRLARPALLIASVLGLYGLSCNRLDYHNNRYVLLLLTFLTAFSACERSFVWGRDAAPPEQRKAPAFAWYLIMLQISMVYLASGGGKLLDADWRGGQVLHLRYLHGLEVLLTHGYQAPPWLQQTLSSFGFASLTSKAAIATELGLAFALWSRPLRGPALWVGTWFHLGIELLARVELFSFIMLTGYIAFARPELRERAVLYDPSRPAQRRLARWIQRLDWLKRFEFRTHTGALSAQDRDGTCYVGAQALPLISRALPLVFPLWVPLRVLTALGRYSPKRWRFSATN